MTAVWGPLGWMTLHSVSTSYPESPTRQERDLVSQWLLMFRDTITCPHCREHFTHIHANYLKRFPNFLESRQEFAMFVFRVHNAVNARLHKPVYGTLAECMDTLKTNIKTRSAREYRVAYLNHIARHWATLQDITGIVALRKVNELKRIEQEYWMARDTQFEVEIRNDAVVIPRHLIDHESSTAAPVTATPRISAPQKQLRMIGGRMRFV